RVRVVQAGLRAFTLPLVRPLETAHGPFARRAGFVVTLEVEAGRLGSGEASPLPEFGGEDLARCHAALRRALASLVKIALAVDGAAPDAAPARAEPTVPPATGRTMRGEPGLAAWRALLADCCADAPVARAALEAALADLAARRAGLSLASWIRRAAGLAGEPAA